MVKINADEAKFLRDSGRGHEVMVSSKTHKSRAKRYYAVESYKTMKMLDEYRQGVISK